MIHGIFRFHEQSGQVIDAIFKFHFLTRIGNHCLHQVQNDAGRGGEIAEIVALMLPVPTIVLDSVSGLYFFVLAEFNSSRMQVLNAPTNAPLMAVSRGS